MFKIEKRLIIQYLYSSITNWLIDWWINWLIDWLVDDSINAIMQEVGV